MELSTAIRERRSIRSFLSDEVPEETVRQILDEARWAPSWANAQGWDVIAVSGAALERVKTALADEAERGSDSVTDIRMPQRGEWPEHIRERMVYRRPSAGEAPPAPFPAAAAVWTLYGAPCLVLFGVHEKLAVEYACFDLGLLVENVCLAALDRGLGTCVMAMAVRHADMLHEIVGAPDTRFVVGLALGVPDPTAAANSGKRSRCDLGDVVRFVR